MTQGSSRFGSFSPVRSGQRGQTTLFVVIGLGIVFLAVLGFAVDFGNLWFHRQSAQTAADAACTAAVMDILNNAQGFSLGNFPGAAGSSFHCSGNGTAAPCSYAAKNGYDSSGFSGGAWQPGPGNDVFVSFPATVDGVDFCQDPPIQGKICIPNPNSGLAPHPLVQVKVTDRIGTYFFGLVSTSKTIDVPAVASCGLILKQAPIPILVLHPSDPNSLNINGAQDEIKVYGGPSQSIQVNSTSGSAVGSTGTIDLSQGGPEVPPTGSDMGTTGGPPNPVGTFLPGTKPGVWGITAPLVDPLATMLSPGQTGPNAATTPPVVPGTPVVPAPLAAAAPNPHTQNGKACTSIPCSVLYQHYGCPDTGGCDVYTGGSYPSGITVKNTTGIFDSGLYYISGELNLDSNSMVRPGPGVGDGNKGTTFYFATSGSVTVAANTGSCTPTCGSRTLDDFATAGVLCPGGSLPGNLTSVATLRGNILLAPCSGYYGDPTGAGRDRGILFFQNRGTTPPTNTKEPQWGGGGSFTLAGTMYFHQCVTGGVDKGTGCDVTNAYNTKLTLGGNACSGTYILGEIIADKITMAGTPCITMDLNPNAAYWTLKASLLK